MSDVLSRCFERAHGLIWRDRRGLRSTTGAHDQPHCLNGAGAPAFRFTCAPQKMRGRGAPTGAIVSVREPHGRARPAQRPRRALHRSRSTQSPRTHAAKARRLSALHVSGSFADRVQSQAAFAARWSAETPATAADEPLPQSRTPLSGPGRATGHSRNGQRRFGPDLRPVLPLLAPSTGVTG